MRDKGFRQGIKKAFEHCTVTWSNQVKYFVLYHKFTNVPRQFQQLRV
ncbi:MAG: hypothetical protein A4E49_02818 [Methanosaeta sp. PtaU1.Bin112]|nr:MAG: hypothetical protein A4E49_02818 [Methanosaeta sp. PtaU1.Bin112]